MNSIRGRLLLYLIPTLLILFGLTAWRVLSVTTHEAEEVFDAELAHFARIVLNLTRHELAEEGYAGNLDQKTLLPEIASHLFFGVLPRESGTVTEGSDPPGHPYEMKLVFQIWDASGQPVFHSVAAPVIPLADQRSGFSDSEVAGRGWRVFSITDSELGITVHTGEDHAVRNELIQEMTSNVYGSLVLGFGSILILVWFLVSWGLSPTRQLTATVARRDPDHLDPIEINKTPIELLPLVESLNVLLERLKRTLDNERRFTSDAAHEIRTPLAGLKLQAQVALRTRDEKSRRDALEKIDQAVNRTMRLIDQLLALARYDAALPGNCRESVDLNQIAAKVIADIEPTASLRQIELSLERIDQTGVSGNPDMLEAMLRNLVDNAVRYNHDGGMVAISLEEMGKELALAIENTGEEISESDRQRVFDRFCRLKHEDGNGTGLGLSIVARIVELHRGTITVSERPDGGTRFRVTLPRNGSI